MRQFDYYNRARDNRPKLCTPEKLRALMASSAVVHQLERVRKAPNEESRAAAKAQLPAICWHGHCTGEKRSKAATQASGLAMLDIDGVVPEGASCPQVPVSDGTAVADRPQWIADLLARIRALYPGMKAAAQLPAGGAALPPAPDEHSDEGASAADAAAASDAAPAPASAAASASASAPSPSPAPAPDGAREAEPCPICLIHITPSGHGLRVVGDMSLTGCRTIEAWQQQMTALLDLQRGEQEGLYHVDQCVKDLSRISFVVPMSEVLYLDEALLWSDPAAGWTYDKEDNDRAATSATSDSDVCQVAITPAKSDDELEQARSFTYNGHTLTEIAEKWLLVHGRPVTGERHQRYFQMVTLFKNICERDPQVLFAQLPDFGKPADERWAMVQDAIRRQPSHALDPDFRSFLIDYGFKEPERSPGDIRAERSARVMSEKVAQDEAARKARDDERLAALMADIEAEAVAEGDWGRYPSVYNIYKRVLPPYMHKPSALALDCIMGTYFSNVTARYLNGKMERPCFHNLIVGPASCGKGFIADIHNDLTRKLMSIDNESLLRWKIYDRERARKRGAKELPEEPDVHYRLMETVFSNSSLLKRQAQGNGLHQLVFCTEMDSLYKNGGHKKFDDIYRCAYHMEDMSQFYLWSDGFNGRVRLLLNVLATGTPMQFAEHYPNPENGLISRVNWCRIKEMFTNEFVAKELTAQERGYLDRVTDFALSLSYGEDEEGKRTFLEPRDITEEMAFMLPVCQDFLDKHLALARETMDLSRDQFRKRIALDMYRGAMVDWGCALGKLDKRRRQTIIDFRRAKAEEMLETKVAEFGEMVNKTIVEVKKTHFPSLYAALPDEFTLSELEQMAHSIGVASPMKHVIYAWNKAGIIHKVSKTAFEKAQKSAP